MLALSPEEKSVLAEGGKSKKHSIARIALDETETSVLVRRSLFTHHLLMLHLNVFFRGRDGSVIEHSVAVPPCFLEDQSSECVLDALQHRFGRLMVPGGAANDDVDSLSVIILNSDSHAALIRLAKYMTAALAGTSKRCITVHSRCQMHQFFACLARMVRSFDLIDGMFCATCLLHRGGTMKALQKEVHADIKRVIKFSYTPPAEEDIAYNRTLLTYVDLMDAHQTKEYLFFFKCCGCFAFIEMMKMRCWLGR